MADGKGMTVVLELEKETLNAVRYKEPEGNSAPVLNMLYVPKWVLKKIGGGVFPKKIVITVDVA